MWQEFDSWFEALIKIEPEKVKNWLNGASSLCTSNHASNKVLHCAGGIYDGFEC